MILLISPKNIYATKRLIQEAKKAKVPLEVLNVEELVAKNFKIDIKKYQTLYIRSPFINESPKYFPQIIRLAKKFTAAGKKVVDSAIAKGELGEGKWPDYQRLMKAGLPIPMTEPLLTSPFEKGEGTDSPPSLHKRGQGELKSVVLKWQYGFRGKHVFLVKNEKQFQSIARKYPKGELLAQEFIDADYEYKIITVGYKALPVVLRFAINKKTHRPDFDNYTVIPSEPASESRNPLNNVNRRNNIKGIPPLPQMHSVGRDDIKNVISLAERASKLLNRELSKVDILQKGNHLYILEVNRWPGLGSFERLTKYNVARKFIEYLTE